MKWTSIKNKLFFFYWNQIILCIILSPLLRGKHTGSYMELATFLSKSLRQCSYEAQWSYCIGGRDIKGLIKKWAPSCSLWSTARVERANRAKELASGFHFIPDRLNEAHGERMGVTFSGWQAGCCMKRTERWREDCWWSREGDRRGAMGCLAAPVRSMPHHNRHLCHQVSQSLCTLVYCHRLAPAVLYFGAIWIALIAGFSHWLETGLKVCCGLKKSGFQKH